VWINEHAFGTRRRTPEMTRKVYQIADYLKGTLYDFVDAFGIDILVVENALCLPMHIPLGVALTHFIAETGIATIAVRKDMSREKTK